MGTVVTIDVRPPLVERSALEPVVAWFHEVDERFSLFRPDSEASRVAAGELGLDDASPELRAIVTLADEVRDRTDGYFDARRHRPDGRLDPTGIVKGWSVDEAILRLRLAGARNAQVNAGGDLVAAGQASPGSPWRIGIQHPTEAGRVAAGARDLGPRGRHLRPVRARRAHPRPAHGPGAGGPAEHDRRRSDPRPRGCLRDRRLRDGGARDRVDRATAGVRRPRGDAGRTRRLDAAGGRAPRPVGNGRRRGWLSRQSQAPGIDWVQSTRIAPGAHP